MVRTNLERLRSRVERLKGMIIYREQKIADDPSNRHISEELSLLLWLMPFAKGKLREEEKRHEQTKPDEGNESSEAGGQEAIESLPVLDDPTE